MCSGWQVSELVVSNMLGPRRIAPKHLTCSRILWRQMWKILFRRYPRCCPREGCLVSERVSRQTQPRRDSAWPPGRCWAQYQSFGVVLAGEDIVSSNGDGRTQCMRLHHNEAPAHGPNRTDLVVRLALGYRFLTSRPLQYSFLEPCESAMSLRSDIDTPMMPNDGNPYSVVGASTSLVSSAVRQG